MVEYAFLTAENALKTLVATIQYWIDSTVNFFYSVTPEFLFGFNTGWVLRNFWLLLMIAIVVLLVFVRWRR